MPELADEPQAGASAGPVSWAPEAEESLQPNPGAWARLPPSHDAHAPLRKVSCELLLAWPITARRFGSVFRRMRARMHEGEAPGPSPSIDAAPAIADEFFGASRMRRST